jgi:hypothetical protein
MGDLGLGGHAIEQRPSARLVEKRPPEAYEGAVDVVRRNRRGDSIDMSGRQVVLLSRSKGRTEHDSVTARQCN